MRTYIVILLCLFLWNCSEDELPLYSGRTCIYFSNMTPGVNPKFQADIAFSFGLRDLQDTVFQIPVTASGDTVSYDRYFSFVVDSMTGTLGTDIDMPKKGILPAGSAVGYIPVTLYRIEGDDQIYDVYFRLIPDQEFELNLPVAYYSGDTVDLTRMKLSYSSSIAEPALWKNNRKLLGYFSVAKYKLFHEVTGRDASFWDSKPSVSVFMAYAKNFKAYIESRIVQGVNKALADPQNTQEKGYMTMREATNLAPVEKIPDTWPDADKRNL